MKVSELIAILQTKNPDSRVITNGYEGGYVDVNSVHEMQVALNYHDKDHWWYGPHESADYWQILEAEKEEGKELYKREDSIWIG